MNSTPLYTDIFDSSLLDQNGLNLQAIFNLADLPEDILNTLNNSTNTLLPYKQLILLAHGGSRLWQALATNGLAADNPVDDFSIKIARAFFTQHHPDLNYEIIYPGPAPIGLQQLGHLAGWHHDSPFKVGVNKHWGSWYAYRAVVLTDSAFTPTLNTDLQSPCTNCTEKFCITACPAGACDRDFELMKCINFRKQPASPCRNQCLARLACPAGAEHRYSDAQVHYHYSVSMKTIEEYY